ncbi:MAG: [protein-PII] uridylyltransferase [Myxococcales bacterium]|nr:[protein-PII] uridylyltransferase [Myxococcales bacterium]
MNVAATLPPLAGRARPEQADACRAFLDEAHARIRAAHENGAPGDLTAREWASAADEVVRALFRAACNQHPGLDVALVAVGGYGRGELCPYSDLDIWLLVPSGKTKDPRAQPLAEAILYPLWDLRMEVGHAVRSVDEALALARQDLTACTALLDARFLDGDTAIWDKFTKAVPRLFDRDVNDVVKRLGQEKDGRHARMGDTVYLLEPNLKNGQGGYRDLLVGLWAAKARFRVRDFQDLVTLGQASQRQTQALIAARSFFLEVRTAAHFAAKRKQDRLTFEIQEAIAPRLFPDPRPSHHAGVESAVEPSVEALMQQYFLHAKAVTRETDRLLQRCFVEPQKKPSLRPVDASFTLFNGKLSLHDPEIFRRRPSEMVRIFNVALDTGAEIYGHTKDLIVERLAEGSLTNDPLAGREFMRLLCDDRDTRNPSLLEQAHDLGLLAAVMPEFAPCTGRVQHDLYHVFTVDQHQLYAVGRLKALARGELTEELPTASTAMKEVHRKEALYLGTLLHDVGKPLGKGHSETGARLAITIAGRLGLTPEDASQAEFLVRKHLLLSHLSQRRDLNDVAMIANVAQELNDEETLRELYLLTVADMSMVAPGNLTEWKEQLLRELYVRTLAFYRRGPDLAAGNSAEQEALVARRKKRVAELLGEPEEKLVEWFASLPERYVTLTPPRAMVREIQLSRRRKGPVAVEMVHRPRKAVSDVTVCADDAPGLLSKIAGVLVAHRIDVLAAHINTRVVDGRVVEALDTFTTRDRYGRPITDAARWRRVEADLARVLSGAADVEAIIEERREKSSLPERVLPQVRTEIEVDNDVSNDFSVVDVYTQDRLGVLYTITRTLAELRLDIQLSKVATEAARVADVFYVREHQGGKLAPDRVDEVRLQLAEALGRLQARAAHD